ncbi:sulfotransferase [Alteromonas sp. ASW11-19]|uniref:Sulfotransferase n=1 Tax=Alteromonas salexigens TaxID=2982530 RepID=A0ABT2VP40_9ALTE|nr:tetratricopeptide repeat-containing sulfotransferase family protein [Alteromonas salexigens]MCU7555081.1 sulfotransferase [Alteromonas salexigens]
MPAINLNNISTLLQKADYGQANHLLTHFLSDHPGNPQALWLQVQCYYAQHDIQAMWSPAEALLQQTETRVPVFERVADMLTAHNAPHLVVEVYRLLLARLPEHPLAHFNLAYALAQIPQVDESVHHYKQAIELGIDKPEEVWLNQSSVLAKGRRKEEAIATLTEACELYPEDILLKFNLATLLEEVADKPAAMAVYRDILHRQPATEHVFERLANADAISNDDHALVDTVTTLAESGRCSPKQAESIYYGLGKFHDSQGHYTAAFDYLSKANRFARQRMGPFDRQAFNQSVNDIVAAFPRNVHGLSESESTAEPIFICGMFRSGTTLVEQILSRHPAVACAGELPFFVNLANDTGGNWLKLSQDPQWLCEIKNNYENQLREQFGQASYVTDKRPDNLLYIGLIKALFPNARILLTRRHPLDTLLSIYSQHLGGNQQYANGLEDIAAYIADTEKLVTHWCKVFGNDIHVVSYESLVHQQESETRAILSYIDLPWDHRCLEFNQSSNAVATASVWQVRNKMYTSSVGRWKHYANQLKPAADYLSARGLL